MHQNFGTNEVLSYGYIFHVGYKQHSPVVMVVVFRRMCQSR